MIFKQIFQLIFKKKKVDNSDNTVSKKFKESSSMS